MTLELSSYPTRPRTNIFFNWKETVSAVSTFTFQRHRWATLQSLDMHPRAERVHTRWKPEAVLTVREGSCGYERVALQKAATEISPWTWLLIRSKGGSSFSYRETELDHTADWLTGPRSDDTAGAHKARHPRRMRACPAGSRGTPRLSLGNQGRSLEHFGSGRKGAAKEPRGQTPRTQEPAGRAPTGQTVPVQTNEKYKLYPTE